MIKFVIVGGIIFIIDIVIFYIFKLMVFEFKLVIVKVIVGIVVVIVFYVLNREWSFCDCGGCECYYEVLLFFVFSGVGVLLSMVLLWFFSYIL